VLSATFYVTAIILHYTKNIYKICNCNHIPWKQISWRKHWCNFYSNRSTFEKVIEKTKGSRFYGTRFIFS